MKMKVVSACAIGLALSGLARAEVEMPAVAEPYQKSFQAAWRQVGAGELPVYECTHVAMVAARKLEDPQTVEDARKAFKACYVDSIVRYSEAYFALRNNADIAEDGKPYGCNMYEQYIKGHVASLEAYLDRMGFSASELNAEITQRLDKVPASCGVEL